MPIETSRRSRPIRQLSAAVVNKIAAGEVIERPASVVKELMENSIDAGATQIEVSIRNGGLDSIRVTDNGSGIPEDELELAVSSHATSKITNADDLFSVATFGFRGEALASIAEVSQFMIRSRIADSDCGHELTVAGGERRPVEPAGMPVGTSISVEELFFNTPVRRKFLRTSQTETGHIAEAFTRIALANPDCHLSLIHNGRTLHDLPASGDLQTRIHDFFGSEIADALIPVDSELEGIRLDGYVVNPAISRSHNRMQYLFLNGRYIRDRSLQHAQGEAYRGLLMTGRFAICFLRLKIPFDQVDVNVHPAKLEVRFQEGGRIYSHLLGAVRNRFLTMDLTSKALLNSNSAAADSQASLPPALRGPRRDAVPGRVPEPAPSPYHQAQIGFAPTLPARNWISPTGTLPGQAARPAPSFSQPATFETPTAPLPPATNADSAQSAKSTLKSPSTSPLADPISSASARQSGRVMALQVHDTYLITESDEGMVVIDQHALHERILYEQIREKVTSGSLEVQQLLVPEPVTLTAPEAAAVLENCETLRRIGIEIQPFGGDTVLITGYPAMLANHNPSGMLRNVIESLMTPGARLHQHDVLDELLHMISCKAAIKAGDRLTRDEITALIEHRALCQDSHHCPHGRPTALVFSREELDRRFKRV